MVGENKRGVLAILFSVKAPAWMCCLLLLISASLPAQLADFDNVDFEKADSVAALYPHHSLKNLNALANKLTTQFSKQEEKFRAIYTWVCLNIKNDYPLYITIKHKREKLNGKPTELREWNKKISKQVFDKLLRDHKTICTGYAYLIRELALHAGLSCKIIDGYGRTSQSNIGGKGTANHSWNVVQLNGKWYLCDATWSSGSIDNQAGVFVKKFDESYFLADPSLFIRNHYPLDTAWALLRDKSTLQEFLSRPLVYSGIYQYEIDQLFPETFDISATKGEVVSFGFRMSSDRIIGKVELKVNDLISSSSFFPSARKDSCGLYSIDHIFTTKGKYVVHILVDFNYLVSYTVTVRK
jgi:transglutaminase/protease-like cytokinesis protein 3